MTKSGENLWLMVKGAPVTKDENGQVVKVMGTFHNITESKNAKTELATIKDIFKRFIQVDSWLSRVAEGSAIGLSLNFQIFTHKAIDYKISDVSGK